MEIAFIFLSLILSSTIMSSSPLQVLGAALKSSFISHQLLLTSSSFQSAHFFCLPLWSPLKVSSAFPSLLPPCPFPSPSIGVMSPQGKRKRGHVLPTNLFLGHPTCLLLFFPSSHPLCLSPGVVSQQDNGKTFSVSSTIRIPVERKDNGAALSCEAFHPALGGQKRIRHYRLDVYCKYLFQAKCVCVCARFTSKRLLSILETNKGT